MTLRCSSIAARLCWLMRLMAVAAVGLSTGACENYPTDRVPLLASGSAGSERGVSLSPASTAAPKYKIGPGDELLIDSFYHSELKQPATVQSDGRISLLLVGSTMAAGKTPEQLSQELTHGYNKFLENADVTVTLTGSAALAVYVGGDVAKPSVVPIKGELSVLQSITAAGGFLGTANREQVLILRQAQDGHFQTFQANASLVLRNEAPEIYLRQHDIVYVPRSAIAQVDQFVDQYINQIIPRSINTTFGFQYGLHGFGGSSATTVTP
jgi:protein involved in polysaccharide export with SLBB domain